LKENIMARTQFENLRVYQMSEQLADIIWDIVLAWYPLAQETVGKQIIRSADSIGANIAEGAGQGTYGSNRRFVRIGRGSLNETRHWLRRAFKRKLLKPEQIETLRLLMDKLSPMLNAYLKSIGRKGPKRTSSRQE